MKYKVWIPYLITSLTCFASEQFTTALNNHKKQVALIVASRNYQPIEYGETRRVLSQAGFSVKTVSTKSGFAWATDGSKTLVDKALNKFKYDRYDGIFIIGGPGAHTELDTQQVYTIMQQAFKAGKVVGAICYSPRILAKAGILQNKKATGWNDDNELESIFKKYGVIYRPQAVVTDGKIVTADGPSSAQAFGQEIIKLLQHP